MGAVQPEDGDLFNARPDAAETEQAIGKFITGLGSYFDRLHTLLSKLPILVATTGSNM